MRRRRFPYTARQIIEHLAKQSAPWSSHDFVKHLPLATLTQRQRKLWALSDLAQINKVAQDLYQANASDRAKAIPAANQMPLVDGHFFAEYLPSLKSYGDLMTHKQLDEAVNLERLHPGCKVHEFKLVGYKTVNIERRAKLVDSDKP